MGKSAADLTADWWTQQNANVNAQQRDKGDTCGCSPLRSAATSWAPVWSLQGAELWGSLSPPGWAEVPGQVSGLRLAGRPAGGPRWPANPLDTCWWKTPRQPLWSLERRRGTEGTISRRHAWRAQNKLLTKRDAEFHTRFSTCRLDHFNTHTHTQTRRGRETERKRERGSSRGRVLSVQQRSIILCVPPTDDLQGIWKLLLLVGPLGNRIFIFQSDQWPTAEISQRD